MSDVFAQIRQDLLESMERNEFCLFRWGKGWDECTEAERAEAHRLRATPLGGGFVAREV